MHGFGIKTCVLLASLLIGCAPVKSKATDYKEKIAAGTKPTTTSPKPKAATGEPATKETSNTPAGNAQSGLAILNANCETAGCHKDGIMLTKTTTINDTTAAKPSHKGLQPVFSPSNIADMKAALATR